MAESIDEYFTTTVSTLASPQAADATVLQGVSQQIILDLFDAQLGSRHLDLAARWLRSQGKGFYTIGSAGHEGNAAVAAALRPTDPALLHYRSGGFFLAARRAGRRAATRCATCCSGWSRPPRSRSPAAGTRCSAATTSTSSRRPRRSPRTCRARSASRSPSPGRAKLGVALPVARRRDRGVQLRRRVGQPLHRGRRHQHRHARGLPGPADAAAVRLRGQRHRHQRQDARGLGRARPTATATVSSTSAPTAPTCRRVYATAAAAADWVRTHRRPAFLHLRTVRLMGHAGSDVEAGLPHTRRDHRRPRPGPGAVHRETAGRARRADAARGARPLRGQARPRCSKLAAEVAELPQLDSPRR